MSTSSKLVLVTLAASLAIVAGCSKGGMPEDVCKHLDELAKKEKADPVIDKCTFKLGMTKGDPKGDYDTLSACLMKAEKVDAAKACL